MHHKGGSGGGTGTGEEDERRALMTLFWCTAGPGWLNKSGWQNGESSALKTWCGIGLDSSGDAVTLVDLRRNGLTGAMPPEVGDLKHLRHLYLGDNKLQGCIPPSMSQLSNLCLLSLRGNKLKGDVAPELGKLSTLQTLSLRDNHLSGTIPPELGQLTALRHLFLNNNNIRGPIPEELCKLGELQQMFLADNELEGPIPPSVGALTRLEELVLSGNQLSGPVPLELSYLTSLQRLELDGNDLSGDIPPSLCALTSLKVLYLNNNSLTGPITPDLGNLSWMERLDLSNNQLTGRVPPDLGQLFSLELLILNNNRLTGPIPCELGRLHHITLLLLGGNQLSEAAPIVGGKGLRQWQVSKRKAYLNSWSMVDRLSHLERENAELRKDNYRLRKTISNGPKTTALPHAPLRVELSSEPTPIISTAANTPPNAESDEPSSATSSSPEVTVTATIAAAAAVATATVEEMGGAGGGGTIATLPPLGPAEWVRARASSVSTLEGPDIGGGTMRGGTPSSSLVSAEGGDDGVCGVDGSSSSSNSSSSTSSTSSSTNIKGNMNVNGTLVRPPREGSMPRARRTTSMGDDDIEPVDRNTARRALLTSAQRRASASSPDMNVNSGRAVRRGSESGLGGGVGGGTSRRARARARAGSIPDGSSHSKHHKDLDESCGEGCYFDEACLGDIDVGALLGQVVDRGAGISSMLKANVPGLSPLRSPMRGELRQQPKQRQKQPIAVRHANVTEATAPQATNGVPNEKSELLTGVKTETTRSVRRSWASLIGMGPAPDNGVVRATNGVGANQGVGRPTNGISCGVGDGEEGMGGKGRARNGAGGSTHGDGSGRVSPMALNSPMSHFMGLFGVGSGGDLSVRGERADSEPESGEVDPDDPRAIRDVVANPNVVCSPE